MGKIKLLDQNVSNKIAAGEVVEKPASVVKELVENSIDANATAITIEIKNGGKTFIRITDNGDGIEDDDTVIAFERHATSKIRNANDLDTIYTLGFRGEALASIGAVSQVELVTKTKDNIIGTVVEVSGGNLIKKEEIGCPKGTTIIIRNLFFNTPARQKFLKSDSAEVSAITNYVEKLALTHPEISFKLINNNNTIMHTSGNSDILTTIHNVFGKEFASAMISLNYENDDIKINGYIGKPEISRSNRNYQCIFINNRYIKDKVISSALDEAYKTYVMVNKYPSAVIYLTVNPSSVDVNVHPSKMEVRFDNNEKIYSNVYQAITLALKTKPIIPNVSFEKVNFVTRNNNFEIQKPDTYNFNSVIEDSAVIEQQSVNETKAEYIAPVSSVPSDSIYVDKLFEIKEIEQETIDIKSQFKIVGQLFSTYIIVEFEDKMYLIDQHAAHERSNYNELTQKYHENQIMCQSLISPIVVELKYDEFKIVEENFETFDKIGYDIETFGENTYLIRGIPLILDRNYGKDFFIEVIDKILNKKINGVIDLREDILYSMACKSAIKANKSLTTEEINQLINDVLEMKETLTCPHGRPVIVSITKYEVEKMFKRV